MGVQEIIWDCRSWWSGADRMGPYSLCYDRKGRRRKKVDRTLAHRDHVHIGLSRTGARMRTSFWRVASSLARPWPKSSHPPTAIRIEVDRGLCIGSGDCVDSAPGVFELDGEDKAVVIDPDGDPLDMVMDAAGNCPVTAIFIYGEEGDLYP